MVSDPRTTRIGLFAGSFDPMTNGHLDILRQAADLFDTVVVAIGVHPGKAPLFTAEERAALVRRVVEENAVPCRVEVAFFDGLTVDEARRVGARAIVRGVRDSGDVDYEMQLAGMNAGLAAEIRTVFLPASVDTRPITATLVRQIAGLGGDVTGFVPPAVAQALGQKFVRS